MHCKTTHGTARRSHITLTVTRDQEDGQRKATSPLFPIKMIAKLEEQKELDNKPSPYKHLGQQNTKSQE